MKTLIQTGSSGRVPVPPEKRFLINNVPAAIGVVIGLLVITWMSLSPIYFTGDLEPYQNPFHSYLTIVIGTLAIFLTGFLLTIRSKK